MIGDKLRDIEAGHQAGCRSILVKTGYGQEEASHSSSSDPLQRPDHVSVNVLEAVDWILEQDFEE
jgi:D-glycero-D-manno-heptose 1,7-bisphosphate phosphatase